MFFVQIFLLLKFTFIFLLPFSMIPYAQCWGKSIIFLYLLCTFNWCRILLYILINMFIRHLMFLHKAGKTSVSSVDIVNNFGQVFIEIVQLKIKLKYSLNQDLQSLNMTIFLYIFKRTLWNNYTKFKYKHLLPYTFFHKPGCLCYMLQTWVLVIFP